MKVKREENVLILIAEEDDDFEWLYQLQQLFGSNDFSWFKGDVDRELIREVRVITEKRATGQTS